MLKLSQLGFIGIAGDDEPGAAETRTPALRFP
jgi:hypothetical protein